MQRTDHRTKDIGSGIQNLVTDEICPTHSFHITLLRTPLMTYAQLWRHVLVLILNHGDTYPVIIKDTHVEAELVAAHCESHHQPHVFNVYCSAKATDECMFMDISVQVSVVHASCSCYESHVVIVLP